MKGYSITMVYTTTSTQLRLNSLFLILVADFPHLTQSMPGSAERVLELQDLNLETQP